MTDNAKTVDYPPSSPTVIIGRGTGVSIVIVVAIISSLMGGLSSVMTDRAAIARDLTIYRESVARDLATVGEKARQASAGCNNNAERLATLERDFRVYLGEINATMGRMEGMLDAMSKGLPRGRDDASQ